MRAGAFPRDERAERRFKKFIVDQSPPRDFQRFGIFGQVNIALCVGDGAERARLADFGREAVFLVCCEQVQRGGNVFCDLLGADAVGSAPDGMQVGELLAFAYPLGGGGGHGKGVIALPFDAPPKAVLRADLECVAEVVLIEVDDFAGRALIVGSEFQKAFPASQSDAFRLCCNGQHDGAFSVLPCLGKRADVPPVFIRSRVVLQQFAQCSDTHFS